MRWCLKFSRYCLTLKLALPNTLDIRRPSQAEAKLAAAMKFGVHNAPVGFARALQVSALPT